MTSNFIDYVKINCKSGHGGAGSRHFRREKHVDKGGPDGGDGGRGGHIVLKGSGQLWTLLHLKYKKHIKAENGKNGEGAKRAGRQGEDGVIEVPLGTIVRVAETGEFLFEITEDGQEVVLLPGGRGGLGNSHFKSSTKQTPDYSQPGEEGQENWFILELKLLADVGLVGFPNAGKSTLLSKVSAATPEIADYPFTTLVPNLGVVSYRDYQSFVMADIPGIIEGASKGKGLGIRFLRHIERNSILLFLVNALSPDIAKEYRVLLKELKTYNPELLSKKHILAISKCDMAIDDESKQRVDAAMKKLSKKIEVVKISSFTGDGILELKDLIWKKIHEV
jgi:GTPase